MRSDPLNDEQQAAAADVTERLVSIFSIPDGNVVSAGVSTFLRRFSPPMLRGELLAAAYSLGCVWATLNRRVENPDSSAESPVETPNS